MICFSFSNRTDELPIVNLEVNGVDYSFLIDTGATCSSISAKFMKGRSQIVLCALLGFQELTLFVT